MVMYRYKGPTIPAEGLYAGRLYTEEERAEIKRRHCLTREQRIAEDRIDRGICVALFIFPIALCVLGTIAEFALLH